MTETVDISELKSGDIVRDGGVPTLILGVTDHTIEWGMTLKSPDGEVWSAYLDGGTKFARVNMTKDEWEAWRIA